MPPPPRGYGGSLAFALCLSFLERGLISRPATVWRHVLLGAPFREGVGKACWESSAPLAELVESDVGWVSQVPLCRREWSPAREEDTLTSVPLGAWLWLQEGHSSSGTKECVRCTGICKGYLLGCHPCRLMPKYICCSLMPL